jgi:hypothetical protein
MMPAGQNLDSIVRPSVNRGWEREMEPEESRRELELVTHRLIDEFSDRIDVDTIARVAREEVLLFDRAKVRDFVVTIAWRLARERLRESLERVDGAEPPLPPGVVEHLSEGPSEGAGEVLVVPEPDPLHAVLGSTDQRVAG